MTSALLSINLINDMIHPDGKMASRGYAKFTEEHDTIQRIERVQDQFRQAGSVLVHSRLGFSPSYPELPDEAGFMDVIKSKDAVLFGTLGHEFYEGVGPKNDEPRLSKQRFSPFYRTRLDLILKSRGVEELFICGCATNLAVESAAREAFDRDYKVTVLSDLCIAGDNETHERALLSMEPFAEVKKFADIAVRLTTL